MHPKQTSWKYLRRLSTLKPVLTAENLVPIRFRIQQPQIWAWKGRLKDRMKTARQHQRLPKLPWSFPLVYHRDHRQMLSQMETVRWGTGNTYGHTVF